MRLLTRIWILAGIVWLFGLGLCPMQAFTSNSRMNASLGPFPRIAYDASNQASGVYDTNARLGYVYDDDSVLTVVEKSICIARERGALPKCADFLAAERTPVGKHPWSPTYYEAEADSHHIIQDAAARTGPQIPGRPSYRGASGADLNI